MCCKYLLSVLLFLYLLCCCCCSVNKSWLTLCDPMNGSMTGFPVLRYFPEFAQTQVHWVCDASQPFHPLLPLPLLSLIFPSIRAFPMSWLFSSGGQNIGASASASVLPMNIQGSFPLGFTILISLLSKRLSRVFFSTTIGKHWFFGAPPSLRSNSHICTWLLEKL